MRPSEFEAEMRWLGWRQMAVKAFDLRPAEAHALTLMMRHPGRLVTFEALAAFDGDGLMNSRCFNGSRGGIVNRVSRMRRKLADVIGDDPVEIVTDGPRVGALGYRIRGVKAWLIHGALLEAFGVSPESQFDGGRDGAGANNSPPVAA